MLLFCWYFFILNLLILFDTSRFVKERIFFGFFGKKISDSSFVYISMLSYLCYSLLAWLLTFDFVNHSKCTSKQKDFNGRNVKIKISEMFSAFTVHLYYLKLPLHCIDTILFWPHSDELWTISNLYQKDIFQKFYCLQKVVAFNKYATS